MAFTSPPSLTISNSFGEKDICKVIPHGSYSTKTMKQIHYILQNGIWVKSSSSHMKEVAKEEEEI